MQCYSEEQFKHLLLFSLIKRKQPLQLTQLFFIKIIKTYSQSDFVTISECEKWFRRFGSGNFNLKNEECSEEPKKDEDENEKLQEILNQNQGRKQEDLPDLLSVTPDTVFSHSKTMGKIDKEGKSDPRSSEQIGRAHV